MHPELEGFFDEQERECGAIKPVSPELANIIDSTREHLYALGCVHMIEFGSAVSGTALSRYSDRDYLAVFPIERMSRNPGLTFDIMTVMMGPLIDGPSSRGELDWPATCLWPLEHQQQRIDVVPSVEAHFLFGGSSPARSGLVSYVFPSNRDEWVGTLPALQTSVLAFSHRDSRCLIRLLKLWKYRNHVTIRSFFLSMFVLRWLENSHLIDLGGAAEIVEEIQSLKQQALYREQKYGTRDQNIAALLGELTVLLQRQRPAGTLPRLADLASPEFVSWAYPCSSETELPDIIKNVGHAAMVATLAARAAQEGDIKEAVRLWKTLFRPHT